MAECFPTTFPLNMPSVQLYWSTVLSCRPGVDWTWRKITHLANSAGTRSLCSLRSRSWIRYMRATGSRTDGLRWWRCRRKTRLSSSRWPERRPLPTKTRHRARTRSLPTPWTFSHWLFSQVKFKSQSGLKNCLVPPSPSCAADHRGWNYFK